MAVWKLPSPLPSSTPRTPLVQTLAEQPFTTTRSGMPSMFTSPMVTALPKEAPEL